MKRVIFCMVMCLACSAAWSQFIVGGFKEGYYFTKDGKKVSGLLKFNYGGSILTDGSNGDCSVTFKEAKGEKKKRLTTEDICCFVIAKDSFTIIENFKLNFAVTYPHDFAQVLETGAINLYLYRSVVSSGGMNGSYTVEDWVIEKNGKADKLNRKNFRKLMPEYLADYPELATKVKTKLIGFEYENSRMIIALYNKHFRDRSN